MKLAESISSRSTRGVRSALPFALMLLGVLATFRSPDLSSGRWRILGLDYVELHLHRIDFALSELAAHGALPAWYPREQMGVPFWSNIQNFPFLPTRLLLLAFGPLNLFTLAVLLSALLSAAFTYLFSRRVGLNAVGAAAAGWTFACSGYFASRVLAGQLGILEVYPALPILLWMVERLRVAREGRSIASWTAFFALACGSSCLGAHPQLAVYALCTTAAYVVWRCAGRRAASSAAAMVLGVSLAGFALVPMAQLVARSNRVLPGNASAFDIVMPYERLIALVSPWRDGAPPIVGQSAGIEEFHAYSNSAYFWDTVGYVGRAPLLAVLALLGWIVWIRRRPSGPALFLALMAIVALALALPIGRTLVPSTPFIVLRSPARLMYLVTFALALGFGTAMHLIVSAPRRWKLAAAGCAIAILSFHFADLYRHDRCFVKTWDGYTPIPPVFERAVREAVGDGRIGMDTGFECEMNRRIDDIGYFDSVVLATTYRGLLDLASSQNEFDRQSLAGWELSARALRACSVRLLVTEHDWPDGHPLFTEKNVRVYEPRDVAARVSRFPADRALYFSADALAHAVRDPSIDPAASLILPESARSALASLPAYATLRAAPAGTLKYTRSSSDRFEITVDGPESCWVRVLEAWDPGWRATMDGAPIPIFPAHTMAMAIAAPAGHHELALEFFTPGVASGSTISACGAALLAAMVIALWRAGGRGRSDTPIERPPSRAAARTAASR